MKNIIILLLIFASAELLAQKDTEFWFAAPEITGGHGDDPIYLTVMTFDEDAEVEIDFPANNVFNPLKFNIAKNSSRSINMTSYKNFLEHNANDAVMNNGLHITSDNDISCYYEVNGVNFFRVVINSDIFSLKGRNALGLDFIIPGQSVFSNSLDYSPVPRNRVIIVATENNTTVELLPSADCMGHSAGVKFTVVLQKGQTYSLNAKNSQAGQHLDGTIISSDKPIAITVSDDSIYSSSHPCKDMTGDQIIPVSKAGNKFIAIRGDLDGDMEQICITATEDDTEIYIGGNTVPYDTIQKAETICMTYGSKALLIETSKPALTWQITGHSCEMGASLLPPLGCTGSQRVVVNRRDADYFAVAILTENGNQNNFTHSGMPGLIDANDFHEVDGSNGQWLYALIDLSNGISKNSEFSVSNKSGLFHLGVIAGEANDATKYGYFSNFAAIDVNISTNAPVCEGDTLVLEADEHENASYKWTAPNGDIFSGNIIAIPNVDLEYEGVFSLTVSLDDYPECEFDYIRNIELYPTLKYKISSGDTLIAPSQAVSGHVFKFYSDSSDIPFKLDKVSFNIEYDAESFFLESSEPGFNNFYYQNGKVVLNYSWNDFVIDDTVIDFLRLNGKVMLGGTKNLKFEISDFNKEAEGCVFINIEPGQIIKDVCFYDGRQVIIFDEQYVNIFPNPVNEEINLKFNSGHEDIEIELCNTLGDVIYKSFAEKNIENIMIPVDEFSSGVYYIRVHSPTFYHCRKIVIVR